MSPYQTAFRANAVNLLVGLLCVFDPKLASEFKTFLHFPEISTLAKFRDVCWCSVWIMIITMSLWFMMIMFDYWCCHASCSLSSSSIRHKIIDTCNISKESILWLWIITSYLPSMASIKKKTCLSTPALPHSFQQQQQPQPQNPTKKLLSKHTGEPEDLGLGAPTAPRRVGTFSPKKMAELSTLSGGMFWKGRFKVFQPSIFRGYIYIYIY